MNWALKTALAATTALLATQALANITLYEHDGFRGRAFTTDRPVSNFGNQGFNDLASSAVVDRGSWEVCTDARFEGRCVVLRRGSYDSLSSIGMNDRISSVRPVSDRGRYQNEVPVPPPAAVYEYRQRANERVYEAPVTSVRAVLGPPEQRCWVEREQVVERGDQNVGGAVLGAIIGGVLGHQVGGGRGKDAATAGGAVAGALIGGNSGNGNNVAYDKNVQRCRNVGSGRPAYWDVTYNYRGIEHRVQMSAPPGSTIFVNRDGVPRQ
ncbi:MAG: glycine zipper 2TM domain-containing protein [Burkholderiales bacterium]|nr:glycine zipper 2TM domain-containing protein [Burkholderiales bacterium]